MAWGIAISALTMFGMMVLAIVEASTASVRESASEKEVNEYKKAA